MNTFVYNYCSRRCSMEEPANGSWHLPPHTVITRHPSRSQRELQPPRPHFTCHPPPPLGCHRYPSSWITSGTNTPFHRTRRCPGWVSHRARSFCCPQLPRRLLETARSTLPRSVPCTLRRFPRLPRSPTTTTRRRSTSKPAQRTTSRRAGLPLAPLHK